MTHETKITRWMHGAAIVEADEWVAAPTRAQTVTRIVIERDGRLPDLHVLNTWRYRILAQPLIRIVDWLTGQKLIRIFQIGAYIVTEGPEESFAKDETVELLRAKYEDTRSTNRKLQAQLRKATDAAIDGENLARALRRVDGLIDEKGRETR